MPDETQTGPSGEQAQGALLGALRAMLRPIARLLLERGITFPVLAELLKEVLVEVARDDFGIPGRKQTDSRLTLLTGVHRKDVRRLRDTREGNPRISAHVSLGALLVSRWMADPAYLDEAGQPLRLPRTADATDKPSFEALVASVTTDITVRSVLDEWLRQRIVEIDSEDYVVLRQESFIPESDFEEKALFFGRNLREHAAAGVHNMLGEGDPYFDRSVFYDQLSAESVQQLRMEAAQISRQAMQEIGKRALALQKNDAAQTKPEKRHRMTWGAYYFGAEVESDDE